MGFFKKVKKIVKKATFGLSDVAIGGADKLIEGVTGMGGKQSDPSGAINDATAAATKAAEDAQRQAAEQAALARQQAEQQAQQLQLMQNNMATDLRGENLNSVVAGGGAAAADVNAAPDPLKRKKASGLSTTLGLA